MASLLVRLFPLDRLDELWVAYHHIAGGFQNVVDGKPVLTRGFHADILTIVFCQPAPQVPQPSRIGREPAAFVIRYALRVRGRNALNYKIAMHVHPAANRINDLQSSHGIPQKCDLKVQAGTGRPAKNELRLY